MEKVIELQKIGKDYQIGNQKVEALKSISLDIFRGEYVAIMGPSGSGKSTLMNVIGALDTPSYGDYILNGKHVSHLGDEELAAIRNKEIGFVFQSFNLLPRSNALENVMLPMVYSGISKRLRMRKALEALRNVGLNERIHHKPSELSGGQRQRVAVARALVNTPSIILADEPTGNLDTKTSLEVMKLFEEIYHKGNTIILVTHEEEIAQYARRIIRLRDGNIESDDLNPAFNK